MYINNADFQGFLNGNKQCFERIFKAYYRVLVVFSMRYGTRDYEAEDIVIEVMHKIWESRLSIKSASALNTNLFLYVKNQSLNTIRDTNNRERIIKNLNNEENEDLFYHIAEEEIKAMLYSYISLLPKQCQRAVLLGLDGKTMLETASEMNISISSVKTYKMRAIKLLKKMLGRNPLLLFYVKIKLEK